jgi:hypothetical protein
MSVTLYVVRQACSASPAAGIVKLGAFDYSTQETTPVVFNGRLVLVEAVGWPSWQHTGRWLPGFNSTLTCNDYFRVRDVGSNRILVNMSSSCNFAFPSAYVTRGTDGLYDRLIVFAQPWNRGGHVQTRAARAAPTALSTLGRRRTRSCWIGKWWGPPPSQALVCST